MGSKSAGSFNSVITVVKLGMLAFITAVAFCYFKIENLSPFLIEKKGFAGVIEGSTILFFGYLGFDFITTISEEAKNP